jgi:predicted nucleic acid-binding protein
VLKIYFDSSAYTKVFSKHEIGSNAARKIIEYVETNNNIQIIMSVWTINETIAAIDQKANQRHEVSKREAQISIATIIRKTLEYSKYNSRIIFIPLDNTIVKESLPFIYDSHISADDALHIFTAFLHDCEYFICQDNGIKQKIDKKLSLRPEKIKMRVLDITKKDDIDFLINNLESL